MAGKNKKKPSKKASDDPNYKHVSSNRKARREYEILDDIECGLVLQGSEVKSVRDQGISIEESYARMLGGELWLVGATINEYPQANLMNHEPARTRKLLLHRRELRKFAQGAEQQGFTLIPLDVYFARGRVKVKLGLAKGRKIYDKRQKLRTDSDRRDMKEAIKKRS
jgi:SsrA-binding protein